MTAKDLIQACVLDAHGGDTTIVETSDFVYGAFHMLRVLIAKKKIKMIISEDADAIHRLISAEHQSNYDDLKRLANG